MTAAHQEEPVRTVRVTTDQADGVVVALYAPGAWLLATDPDSPR